MSHLIIGATTQSIFFFKTLVTSNFVSSFSLDDDELELFEWCEGFSIRISIIKKNNSYEIKT